MTDSNNVSPYALEVGEQDQERLIILNELHNSSSLSFLNITPGMRVLTIGCGIGLLELEIARRTTLEGLVVATDINAKQLIIAEQNRKNLGLSQLQFFQVDALDIQRILGEFDRVHCRFVLTHLPLEKVFQVLSLLYSKLASGGILVLEEIATIDTLRCEPVAHLGYDMWKMGVQKQFTLQQSDTSPGYKIFQYLQENGYAPSYSSYQPILSTPREKSILSLGVLSASKRFLQEGLMSFEKIEEILVHLHQLEQDSGFFPRYNEISQIAVHKPA